MIDDGPMLDGLQPDPFSDQPPFDVDVLSHAGPYIVFIEPVHLQDMLPEYPPIATPDPPDLFFPEKRQIDPVFQPARSVFDLIEQGKQPHSMRMRNSILTKWAGFSWKMPAKWPIAP